MVLEISINLKLTFTYERPNSVLRLSYGKIKSSGQTMTVTDRTEIATPRATDGAISRRMLKIPSSDTVHLRYYKFDGTHW